jgi:hypothetical protein
LFSHSILFPIGMDFFLASLRQPASGSAREPWIILMSVNFGMIFYHFSRGMASQSPARFAVAAHPCRN